MISNRIQRISLLAALSFLVASASAASVPSPAPSVPLVYRLDRATNVSLNIYNSRGQIVRELLHAAPRRQGPNHEAWDGLDEHGSPAPAGAYTWKLLGTQGLHAKYLMTLGTNPNPAWDTWPGNHNGVHAVAADDTGFYFAGGCAEGPPTLVKVSLDGKRLWTVSNWFEAWQGGHSMTVAAGKLFMMQDNGKIQVMDAATGKLQATWDEIWQASDLKNEDHMVTALKMDIAARGDQLVMAFRTHDAVRWLDPGTGKTLDQAAVPEPLGIALGQDGRMFVISKNRVLSLTRADKTPRVVVSGLTDPWRLTVDTVSGDILVAERGTSQQVKRFSADGKLLRSYGTPGGRPRQGRYDPTGFADIAALAADGRGGFLAAEPEISPRRTAHFDKDGSLLREWYGGQQYADFAAADPEDPTSVWFESAWGELTQARVDYAKKTWQVYATYQYIGLANGLVQTVRAGNWNVRHHDGQTYLVRSGWPVIVRVDETNRCLIPMVATRFTPNFWKPAEGWPPFIEDARKKFGETQGDAVAWLVWTDRNGDGKATLDEVADETMPVHWVGGDVGPGFTYHMSGGDGVGNPNCGVWELSVQQWLPGGVPVYGFGAAMKRLTPNDPQFDSFSIGSAPDGTGGMFAAYNPPLRPNVNTNRVARWDKNGRLLWVAGRLAEGSEAAPGESKRFHHVVGTAHGCFVVADYADSMIPVWDPDGLWVGRLLDNPDLAVAPQSAYQLCGENFGDSVYEDPKTGDVLLFGGGWNNSPVYRITGWDKFTRQHGALTVSPALSALLAQRHRQEILKTAPGAAAIIPYVASITPDGNLADWQGVSPLKIMDGKVVRALAYLAWNANGLYAAFDVRTRAPWKSTSSLPLAFQGGAAVDVDLGPTDPPRDKPGPGDYRIVAAPIDGATHLAIFMPSLAPGMDGGYRHPQTYKTGLGEVTYERVEGVRDPVACRVKPDGSGYIVEMRVPAFAPVTLQSHSKLRLDLSVILSNLDGTHSQARIPWHSQDPGDRMTNDTYTESLLRPQNWSLVVLE